MVGKKTSDRFLKPLGQWSEGDAQRVFEEALRRRLPFLQKLSSAKSVPKGSGRNKYSSFSMDKRQNSVRIFHAYD